MKLTIDLHESWMGHAAELASLLECIAALEQPHSAQPAPRGNGHHDAPAPQPPAKERRDWPAADHGEAAPSRRDATDEPPPKSGGALYAWLKSQDEENNYGVFKHVNAWAKRRNVSGTMKTWSPGDIRAAWQEAHRQIGRVLQAERDTDDVNAGR